MKDEKKQLNKFPGFPPESQTWNFPNIINGFVHQLNGSEFKVLWYILRRTYGWQKDRDKVSLTQFEKGIFSKKKSEWVDRGTGLSRQSIINALEVLVEKGFIRKTKGKINSYEVVKKLDQLSQKNRQVSSPKIRPTIFNRTIFNKQKEELIKKLEDWFYRIGKSPSLAKGLVKKYGFERIERAYKHTCDSGGTKDTFFREIFS